jgi:hypothetical protein
MNDKAPRFRSNIVSQYLLRPTRTLEQAENDAERRRMLTNPIAPKPVPELKDGQPADSKKPLSLCSGTDSDGGSLAEDMSGHPSR